MTSPALERLKVLPQYFVPHHLLSRTVGYLADSRWPLVKNAMIDFFLNRYGINMSEAQEEDAFAYPTFNEFFTRALKPELRPIDKEHIVCPADGVISQLGKIDESRIFQAKGHHFTLQQLLGGCEERAKPFINGQFATVYLSPKDYHRVHMPLQGSLKEMIYVPGRLFSVNNLTASQVPGLFARNERVVCLFDTALGPMAVILVGAMIVASVETVWAGLVTPPKRELKVFNYQPKKESITLDVGAEMGRFKLGSTAIVLLGEGTARWDDSLTAGSAVTMGQRLGHKLTP